MSVTHGAKTSAVFTSLNGLDAGDYGFCAQIDISAVDAHDVICGGHVVTINNWEVGEQISLYVTGSADKDAPTTDIGGGVASGLAGADAVEDVDTDFKEAGLIHVETIAVNATTAEKYVFRPFSLLQVFGFLPAYFQFVIANKADAPGETLNVTDGGDFYYSLFKYPTT